MITVKLKHTYQVPSRWDDFTPELRTQFVTLCCAMDDFEKGIFDFKQFQICAAFALLCVDIEKIHRPGDILYENAYKLTELLTFPYILQTQEDGSMAASAHICINRNILPELGGHKGYTLEVPPAGVVNCDLTAEKYVDALTLTDLYTRTRKDSVLEGLVRVLYGSTEDITLHEMTAVYYNFRGFLEWLQTLPQYALIFRHTGRKKGGDSPLGLASSIFTVSKQGYGTLKEIKELDVFSYLGVLVQMSIDSIHQLAAASMKAGEISEKTRIPIDLVLLHLNDTEQ